MTNFETVKDILFSEAEELSPETLGLTGEDLTKYLASVDKKISTAEIEASDYKTQLGIKYELAIALLTAHNMTEQNIQKSGKSGVIIEEKVNEETVKYKQNKEDSGEYSGSSYGQRFYKLIKPFIKTKKRKFNGFAV